MKYFLEEMRFLKKIIIDKRKLKNNHDYDNLVAEMNSYNDVDYKPNDEDVNHWEQRRKYFKNAYSKQVGNISIVAQPNMEFTPYLGNGKFDFKSTCKDFRITLFYKGVSVGTFSSHEKRLCFDRLLEDTDFIEKNINQFLELIPFKKFDIKYNTHYVDWDNRPFIVVTC